MASKAPQIKLNPQEATAYLCPKCQFVRFGMGYKLLKVSKLAPSNTTGQDIFIPAPIFHCEGCGHILDDIKPG